jgi:hypothetical protein
MWLLRRHTAAAAALLGPSGLALLQLLVGSHQV